MSVTIGISSQHRQSELAVSRSGDTTQADRPTDRAEAATQFESHLVKQMVDVMFEGVFSTEQSGVANIGSDKQKEVLIDELTKMLTQDGGLGLADAMLKQWNTLYGDTAANSDSAEQMDNAPSHVEARVRRTIEAEK